MAAKSKSALFMVPLKCWRQVLTKSISSTVPAGEALEDMVRVSDDVRDN